VDVIVQLIGTSSEHGVAAILVADERECAVWYNRRLVHGPTLGLVELWARRAVETGWRFSMLSEADVAKLGA
jgi:Asp/Glu/hydantoin racemase